MLVNIDVSLKDFARLPWQNQPSHTPATSAGPPGITSLTARGAYPVPGRESGATTVSLIGTPSPSVPGTTSQVSDVSSDEVDIREPAPSRFSSTTPGGGGEGQARLPQDSSLLFQSYTNASTPLPESNVVEVTTASKGMLGNSQSSTTPSPAEQVGLPVQDPSLTTGEALEKYSSTAQKLDLALSRASSQLSLDDEVRTAMNEIPEIIMQCVSRDEAALAIAQKVFKRLYENTTSQAHVRVHLGILESIRDVCKRVVKELTSWESCTVHSSEGSRCRKTCWSSVDAKFRFHGEGESPALVTILQGQLSLLEHPQPTIRRASLISISSHLDLTRELKTREELFHALKFRLWKEEEPFLVQSLIRVLVGVALVPLVASSVLHHELCACIEKVSEERTNLQTRDGLVSSTTSPLQRKKEKWCVDGKLAIAKLVAEVLRAYLGGKDRVESSLLVQVLHSLLKIGENTEAVVTWESVGGLVRGYLRSSNPKVRALVLRLLVESVQENLENAGENEGNAKRRRVGNYCLPASGSVQGSGVDLDVKSGDHLKAGEMLLSSLLSYMKDPYPSVRETALRGLIKLHTKGYKLTSECCKMATSLFRDSFESVRIAAIEMVGLWMRSRLDVKDGSSSKQRTEAFLQVCTTVTDMNMRVRESAFRVLGEATRIPESVLLQTLTKKVAKTPKETDVSVTASRDGDTDSPKFEESANLLDASAAGAFVHGLEDEFFEVRCVAIEALASLACMCQKMVFGAASLLLDMLNEEVEVVRMQAMHALSQLATAGYLSVHDQHLHLFLSVLEDTSPEMRKGGRNLLASSLLPSFSTFHSIVRSLLSSLEQHLEDEEGVILTFSVLGQAHPTYTECITQELLQEMQGYLNEEVGLDEPRFAAILSLFLGAGLSNSNIVSLIPARLLSYANFISHKLPESLPLINLRPVGLKSVQFSWSNGEKLRRSAIVRPQCRALRSSPVAKPHIA